MRRIKCDDRSATIARNITGEYILKPKRSEMPFYGRQMPNGKLFVPYIGYVEMYEPGEYKFVYHCPRTKDEEDYNNA
jgi:hypothetical protein